MLHQRSQLEAPKELWCLHDSAVLKILWPSPHNCWSPHSGRSEAASSREHACTLGSHVHAHSLQPCVPCPGGVSSRLQILHEHGSLTKPLLNLYFLNYSDRNYSLLVILSWCHHLFLCHSVFRELVEREDQYLVSGRRSRCPAYFVK